MEPTESDSHPAIASLKHYARILHRRIQQGDPAALRSVRALREFADTPSSQLPAAIQRKHCLSASALRVGFRSWQHACAVLADRDEDYGTTLYPSRCYGHTNIWSADYGEAQQIRAQHGGYLLAYRRQFLVVDAGFIDSLGLDPRDPDWDAMGRDWVRPADRSARARLYEKLVHNALVLDALAPA